MCIRDSVVARSSRLSWTRRRTPRTSSSSSIRPPYCVPLFVKARRGTGPQVRCLSRWHASTPPGWPTRRLRRAP
eukprot:5932841-Alexandrium_andersonii.AAC.1